MEIDDLLKIDFTKFSIPDCQALTPKELQIAPIPQSYLLENLGYRQTGIAGDLFSCLDRCPGCPATNRIVHSDGKVPCDIMVIGEMPGMEGDSGSRPYTGKEAREFHETFLHRMGISRQDIYFTNTVKCRTANGKKAPDKVKLSCAAHYITNEISLVQPKVIFLCGAVANTLPGIEIDLEKDHGYPIKLSPGQGGLLGDFTGYVIPFYHFSSGNHNTSMLTPLLRDTENFQLWNNELWEPPVDQIPERHYELVTTQHELLDRLISHYDISVDTESNSFGQLWSAQWSQLEGTGYAILIQEHPGLLKILIEFINDSRDIDFIAQYALHDWQELYRYGLYVPGIRIQDTMQRSFHFGDLPQGLKAMASRLLGCRMQAFMSVVGPSSLEVLRSWLEVAMLYAGEIAPQNIRFINKALGRYVMEPKETALSRAITRIQVTKIDHFKKADMLFRKYGLEAAGFPTPPKPGIEYVDPKLALWYMCQDSDLTLRCLRRLKERAQIETTGVGRLVTEVDPWRNPKLDRLKEQKLLGV